MALSTDPIAQVTFPWLNLYSPDSTCLHMLLKICRWKMGRPLFFYTDGAHCSKNHHHRSHPKHSLSSIPCLIELYILLISINHPISLWWRVFMQVLSGLDIMIALETLLRFFIGAVHVTGAPGSSMKLNITPDTSTATTKDKPVLITKVGFNLRVAHF